MYLVFAYDMYYPSGGSADFVGAFDTMDAAVQAATEARGDFSEVYGVAEKTWYSIRQ